MTQLRSICIILIVIGLSACSLIENILDAPMYVTRECCYINPARDTIFFDCKSQKTEWLRVSIKRKWANERLFFWDTIIGDRKEIPLSFIYNRIPKDSLLNKYFHIIVESKSNSRGQYWFILNSADLGSKEIIYSYIQIRGGK